MVMVWRQLRCIPLNNPYESADSDGDGVGDNADAFPNDATETTILTEMESETTRMHSLTMPTNPEIQIAMALVIIRMISQMTLLKPRTLMVMDMVTILTHSRLIPTIGLIRMEMG